MAKKAKALLILYGSIVALIGALALATTDQPIDGMLIARIVVVSALFVGLYLLVWRALTDLAQSRPVLVGAMRGTAWGAGLAYLGYWAAGDPLPSVVVAAYKIIGMGTAFAYLAAENWPRPKVPNGLRKLFHAESLS